MVDEDNVEHKKTSLKSVKWSFMSLLIFTIMFGTTIGLDFLYKESFYKLSISDSSWSIQGIQKASPKWWYEFMRFQTSFGGGLEVYFFSAIALFFLPRSRFFYYMALIGLKT